MRSVVVGARGFIGHAVVEELLDRGREVVALDLDWPARYVAKFAHPRVRTLQADIMNPTALHAAFDGADEVYHFAGRLGTSELESDLRGSFEINVLGTLNVMEAASRCGVPRVFQSSKPSVWLNTYTVTKHAAEQAARLFTRQNPVQVSIFRYLNVYGPGQKLMPVRKILPIFAAQAMRGLPIQVYGSGAQTVDMLYSRDAARLTVDLLSAPFVADPLDCGTGKEVSVREVAEAINAFFDNKAGIAEIPMRRGETPNTRLVADIEPLRSLLPGLKFTPWETALAESLKWYAALPDHQIDSALSFYGVHHSHGTAWI